MCILGQSVHIYVSDQSLCITGQSVGMMEVFSSMCIIAPSELILQQLLHISVYMN